MKNSEKKESVQFIKVRGTITEELKHGTISLIEQGVLVTRVLIQSKLYKKKNQ